MEVCCRSDVNGINGSRDVTFPYPKKGSREHILSCLIAYRIPYDKQTREVVGREGSGAWMGTHSAALPPTPDAFANYLLVDFREVLKCKSRNKLWAFSSDFLDCRVIALINLRGTILSIPGACFHCSPKRPMQMCPGESSSTECHSSTVAVP